MRSNAVNLSYIFNDGELLFEGTVPITDATGRLSVPALSLYRSLSVFGRSANVTATLPYGVGNFKGTAFGAETSVYRSGLMDSVFRLSVNLKGGPAMELSQMRQWRQKHLLGASLKLVAPTGQYDPTKLINLGGNRWAFKPEIGYSGRFGHWISTPTAPSGSSRATPSSSRATSMSRAPRTRRRTRSAPSRRT